jgi:hypothetical protein
MQAAAYQTPPDSTRGDREKIKTAIGIDAQLPHLNASKRAGYRDYFDDETRAIVADWFREDIDLFGYRF